MNTYTIFGVNKFHTVVLLFSHGAICLFIVGAGSTLRFSTVDKDDSGDYVCFAENVAGLTTSSVTLDVQCEYP